MRSTKDQHVKKDVLMPVKHNVFLWNLPDVEEVPSHDGETILLWSLWKRKKREVPLRTAYSQAGRLWQPKPSSLRAQAQLMRTETVETFELVKVEPKLLREKQRRERDRIRKKLRELSQCLLTSHVSSGGLEVACTLRKHKVVGSTPAGVCRFSGCENRRHVCHIIIWHVKYSLGINLALALKSDESLN
ncbi:hypothetical protein TNCV_3787221 [Trichonephila clavipes]|nr:hypothetical protein TNCV_3787221 [Trichonephila clavipes]